MEFQDVRALAEGLQFPKGRVALAHGLVLVGEIEAGRLAGLVRRLDLGGGQVGGGPNGLARRPDGAIYCATTADGSTSGSPFDPAGRP